MRCLTPSYTFLANNDAWSVPAVLGPDAQGKQVYQLSLCYTIVCICINLLSAQQLRDTSLVASAMTHDEEFWLQCCSTSGLDRKREWDQPVLAERINAAVSALIMPPLCCVYQQCSSTLVRQMDQAVK